MPRSRSSSKTPNNSTANLGFEAKLWLAADKLRSNMDAAEYKAVNVVWVPPGVRWTYLQNSAKQPEIGKIVDDAMVAIERDNPRPKQRCART